MIRMSRGFRVCCIQYQHEELFLESRGPVLARSLFSHDTDGNENDIARLLEPSFLGNRQQFLSFKRS